MPTNVTYGPVVVATPTPVTTDGNALAFDSDPLSVYDAQSGGTQLTALTAFGAGTVVSGQVVPDSATGAVGYQRSDGVVAVTWIADPATSIRYPVVPNEITSLTGGVSSVAVNGGTAQTGAVALSVTADTVSDATTVGKASMRAADQSAGRSAIGAGTSSLALGTTSTTARAGNWVPTASDVGAVSTTVFPIVTGTVNPLTAGDVPIYDSASSTWTNGPPPVTVLPSYLLQGTILNPGQSVPSDWPNGAIAFVRATAPTLGATQIGKNGTSSSATTVTVTLTDAVANGENIYVSVSAAAPGGTLSTITVTDSSSNSWSLRGQRVQSAALQEQAFSARVGSGTTLAIGGTVTVTFGAAVGDAEVTVSKMTGVAASPALDQQGQNSITSGTSLTVSTSATSQANEIAMLSLAFSGASNGVVDPTTWATTGWAQVGTTQTSGGSNPRYSATLVKVLTTAAAVSVTPQISAASGFIALLNTFKAA